MKRRSKFLSYLLRHHPEELDLELDSAGWVDVDVLLKRLVSRDDTWTLETLLEVVDTNDKQRFEFSDDGSRIRARQGHSIDVDLGLDPVAPPAVLYHGTVAKFLEAIGSEGLRPMSRHDVHLSPDRKTAMQVGGRRGKPVILEIDASAMHDDGYEFRCTGNDVWLVAEVPPRYIRIPEAG